MEFTIINPSYAFFAHALEHSHCSPFPLSIPHTTDKDSRYCESGRTVFDDAPEFRGITSRSLPQIHKNRMQCHQTDKQKRRHHGHCKPGTGSVNRVNAVTVPERLSAIEASQRPLLCEMRENGRFHDQNFRALGIKLDKLLYTVIGIGGTVVVTLIGGIVALVITPLVNLDTL